MIMITTTTAITSMISLILWQTLIVSGSPIVTKTIKSTKSPSTKKINQRQQLSDVILKSPPGTLNYCDKPVCYSNNPDGRDLGCFDPWPLTIYDTLDLYKLCPQDPSHISASFELFTVDDPKESLKLSISNVQQLDLIQPSDKIVFFIHGYKNTFNDSRFLSLKDELLSVVQVVIMVDFAIAANPGVTSKVTDFYNFHQAATNTQVIGRQIAILLQQLKKQQNIDYNNVHIICFSLGSLVGHFAGSFSQLKLDFQVGRITALDPPGILIFGPGKRLDPSDAKFVDVIHTTTFNPPWDFSKAGSGKVGTSHPLGHVDFYPNGGGENDIDQPGCSGTEWCSHSFSLELMKASLRNCQFEATPCSSYHMYSNGRCNSKFKNTRLGYWSINYPGRGRYYLNTSKNPTENC